MNKSYLSILILIFLFSIISGCTLVDETVKIKITDQNTLESVEPQKHYVGVLNLTVYSDFSETIKISRNNIQLIGVHVNNTSTKLVLEIYSFDILDNRTEFLEKGEKRSLTITHALFENITLYSVKYKYRDIEITLDKLSKKKEGESVVQQSFLKSNYFMIVLIFLVGILAAMIIMGKKEKTPQPGKNVCRFCLKDLSGIDEKKRVYCNKWLTRTRRCGAGPFCSKKCLKYHWEDISHEN